MNLSPDEAEQSLAAIQDTIHKTRRSLAGSGAYIFLVITGAIWLVGFLATQFLPAQITVAIWIAMSVLGSGLSIWLGKQMGQRVRGPSTAVYAKRVGLFWLLLVGFAVAAIAVAHPADGKQMTMLIILFILIGQMAMGLLFTFSAAWWSVPVAALALAGYFLLAEYFYLWMGVLVGGGMIALGLYIRARW